MTKPLGSTAPAAVVVDTDCCGNAAVPAFATFGLAMDCAFVAFIAEALSFGTGGLRTAEPARTLPAVEEETDTLPGFDFVATLRTLDEATVERVRGGDPPTPFPAVAVVTTPLLERSGEVGAEEITVAVVGSVCF